LIIHGEADLLIPVQHGRKLAETIPNAQSIWLEGVGHIFPLPGMEAINQRILAHMTEAK
jgi:pimeloyl-ACP methyl ester carboxylesterase